MILSSTTKQLLSFSFYIMNINKESSKKLSIVASDQINEYLNRPITIPFIAILSFPFYIL